MWFTANMHSPSWGLFESQISPSQGRSKEGCRDNLVMVVVYRYMLLDMFCNEVIAVSTDQKPAGASLEQRVQITIKRQKR